jgi:hypothetical protein
MMQINKAYRDILDGLKNGVIPEAYPPAEDPLFMSIYHMNTDAWRTLFCDGETDVTDPLGLSGLMARDEIVRLSGFALVSYNWVRPLSQWIGRRKCLEVMCGSGILSKALRDCGVSVTATDNASWSGANHWWEHPWTDVEKLGCIEAVGKYGKDMDLILCSWPPMDDDISYRLLLKMREVNPALVMIYIGEMGGATACKEFFDAAKWIECPSFQDAVTHFTQIHSTIHDRPYLLK